MADENSGAALAFAWARWVVGAGHRNRVESGLDARVAVHIEMRLVRLADGFEQVRGLLHKVRRQIVLPGLHGNANVQVGIHLAVILAARRRLNDEDLNALIVEGNFDLVLAGQAFDVFVAITREAEADFVFAIFGEIVVDECAATSAEGEVIEVAFLSEIRREHNGIATGRFHRASDGETADLFRSGEIAFEQGGGEFADGHVVKAMARIVRREQGGNVYVEIDQIADGVVVFGAIHPAEGVGSAGIGMGGGGAVDGAFERGDDGVVGFLVGARQAGGWHLAGLEFADHLFPGGGVLANVFCINGLEGEAGGLHLVVVAGDAVLVGEGGLEFGSLLWNSGRDGESGQRGCREDTPG